MTISAAGNYEVRPEGLFIFDNAPGIAAEGIDVNVDYTHGAYDSIQAVTQSAPILEMRYAGLNEAMSGSPCMVDVFRVQLGASGADLINSDFATLLSKGEVLADPTKTGVGTSRFFEMQMLTPA